jgi:hypothetical protein
MPEQAEILYRATPEEVLSEPDPEDKSTRPAKSIALDRAKKTKKAKAEAEDVSEHYD